VFPVVCVCVRVCGNEWNHVLYLSCVTVQLLAYVLVSVCGCVFECVCAEWEMVAAVAVVVALRSLFLRSTRGKQFKLIKVID